MVGIVTLNLLAIMLDVGILSPGSEGIFGVGLNDENRVYLDGRDEHNPSPIRQLAKIGSFSGDVGSKFEDGMD